MRDDYHIFLRDVSRRATGNSRYYGRRLFLSPGFLRTLYPSIPGQTIPSTFGHYKTALTVEGTSENVLTPKEKIEKCLSDKKSERHFLF